jgi:(E)-4-hydroxy-3-methylbut-2-enyl-diphosphate synthase
MDTVVAEIEDRLRAYEDPIEVAVLGCAVNGIGEASHADFGIAGAKDMGVIYSQGKPLRKVPTAQLVDVLFEEIDKYYAAGKKVVFDEEQAAEGAALLAQIEADNAGDLTPERIAAMEHAASQLDEAESPVAGRRFQRA